MLKVYVNTCGPIRDSILELPERGLVVIIGPNLSGKSLLVSSLGGVFAAVMLTDDGRAFKSLGERLAGDEAWRSLYELDVDGRNVLDPQSYLTMDVEYESPSDYVKVLSEVIHKNTEYSIGSLKDYLARTILAAEICLARGVKPWLKEAPPKRPFSVDLKIEGGGTTSFVSTKLPAGDPEREGYRELVKSVSLIPLPSLGVWGLNISRPNIFVEMYHERRVPTPSSRFVRVLRENYSYTPDYALFSSIKGLVSKAWSEISGMELDSEKDVDIFEKRGEGLKLKVFGDEYPWSLTSDGVVNLMALWLVAGIMPFFRHEGKRPLLSVEEPESHLDPYSAYLLPRVYAELVRGFDALILVATHSEAFVKGVEDSISEGLLDPGEVGIYETRGEKKAFRLHRCEIDESGRIRNSRLTTIARKILLKT